MGQKWSKAQHLKFMATMKRKRDSNRQLQQRTIAEVIEAEPVIPESVGEEMLRLAHLCVAKHVSDRAMIGLLVHYVHTFASVSE